MATTRKRYSGEFKAKVALAALYQQIGQLKVELDFLKKKTGMLG